jgi:hypothetical protein
MIMSRITDDDYEKLRIFLNNYSLKQNLSYTDYSEKLKQVHKKLYAFMVYIAEIEKIDEFKTTFDQNSRCYLREVLSDFIQALFCWCNGVYKSGLLSLRSSIEVFCKVIIGINQKDVYVEKSVYEIFNMAKTDKYLSMDKNKKYYYSIHDDYKKLCEYVHSASDINLDNLGCVGLLPSYRSDKSEQFIDIFIRVICSIIAIMMLSFDSLNKSISSSNMQIIKDALSNEMKKEIFSLPFLNA